MDLLNAAVYQLERQGMSVILDRCSSPLDKNLQPSCPDAAAAAEIAASRLIPRTVRRGALQGYLDRLFAMLGFIGSVATGPSGPHAHFLQHSVDALTIRSVGQGGRRRDGGKGVCAKSLRVGTGAVLSIARGISNLEEELHHSFFVYVMLSTQAFVSIGVSSICRRLVLLGYCVLRCVVPVPPSSGFRVLPACFNEPHCITTRMWSLSWCETSLRARTERFVVHTPTCLGHFAGEYAYSMVLLLFPLAMQAGRLPRLYKDKTLLRAVLIVGTFQGFGALLFLAASIAPEPSAEALYLYLNLVTLAGYLLVMAVRLFVYHRRSTGQLVEKSTLPWEGSKMVIACLVAYFCCMTALLSWPVAAVLALTHVPMLVTAKPLRAASVASWCVLPFILFSMPACWTWLLGAATGRGSGGIAVMLQWLRWYRVSGLLNVPLLCLVSIPAHLTTAFVLISPQGGT